MCVHESAPSHFEMLINMIKGSQKVQNSFVLQKVQAGSKRFKRFKRSKKVQEGPRRSKKCKEGRRGVPDGSRLLNHVQEGSTGFRVSKSRDPGI